MIFSIGMGAEYLSYMKSIETHARAFLALIILPIGTVCYLASWLVWAEIECSVHGALPKLHLN